VKFDMVITVYNGGVGYLNSPMLQDRQPDFGDNGTGTRKMQCLKSWTCMCHCNNVMHG
jgi:hypothetical protein